MSGFKLRLAAICALCVCVPAFAVGPDAPTVTVSAAPKQLKFKWNYVPRANWYEVWFRANPGASWVKYAEAPSWRPRVNIGVSVHLLDWRAARYRVAACNPGGCTPSSEVSVTSLMPWTPAEVATTEADNDEAGWTLGISEDGRRLVSGSIAERSAAVFVWRKEGTSWTREATLVPIIQSGAAFRHKVAINADGSVIAVGEPNEDRPNVNPESEGDTGAVYLYRRTGTTWSLEQKLNAPNEGYIEQFGFRVALDASGNLLAAWRFNGGAPVTAGSVDLYRHSSAGWVHEALIPSVGDSGAYCDGIALSGDGQTFVHDCIQGQSNTRDGFAEVFRAPTWQRVARLAHATTPEDHESIGISFDGTRIALHSVTATGPFGAGEAHVNVFENAGGLWSQTAMLDPGPWMPQEDRNVTASKFGEAMSMSSDGRFLAVGDWSDRADGSGVIYPPISTGDSAAGAVYVFERVASGWRQRQFIKPFPGTVQFGLALSFAENGRTLAVGAPEGSSGAPGTAGAIWIY